MEIRNQPNRPLPSSDNTRPQRGAPREPQGEEPERISQRELGKRTGNVRQTIQQQEQIGQRAQNVRQTVQAQEAAERIQNAREAALAQRVQSARSAAERTANVRSASNRTANARSAADRIELSAGARALSESVDPSELAAHQERIRALTSQFHEGRLVTEERIQSAAEKLLGGREARG